VQFKTGRLEVAMSTFSGVRHVEFVGQLDERADLRPVVEDVGWSVVFDLAAVSFINSIGVREWLRLLRNLHEKGVLVLLRRCSEAMVLEMNMIVETVQYVRVESLYLPYACDACGYEASLCIEVERHRELLRNMKAPPQRCHECPAAMTFSEIPGRYLLFAAQAAENHSI
jgi:hypothetical protein